MNTKCNALDNFPIKIYFSNYKGQTEKNIKKENSKI